MKMEAGGDHRNFSKANKNEVQSKLPSVFCTNPRKKIEAEKVQVTDITTHIKRKTKTNAPAIPTPRKFLEPKPVRPLAIICVPIQLCFEIDEITVIKKLRIWNGCTHTIYVHCCGLWDETARFGASWQCYPRTRFLLAPGLMGEIFIKATPRLHSPVPYTYAGLQLAAAHMRDHVNGYFVIPLRIIYRNYVPPYMEEG